MADKDYLANLKLEPGDKLDYGVRGMRWGIRRSSSQLRAAAAKRAAAPATPGTKQTDHLKKHSSNIQDHVESSSSRYARLAAEAKKGQADKMTDADLKFFNARTEALQKINKLNEQKPGWLAETSKKVLQRAAQTQMQAVTDAVANKYISGPIIENIGKRATQESAKASASQAVKKVAEATVPKVRRAGF